MFGLWEIEWLLILGFWLWLRDKLCVVKIVCLIVDRMGSGGLWKVNRLFLLL